MLAPCSPYEGPTSISQRGPWARIWTNITPNRKTDRGREASKQPDRQTYRHNRVSETMENTHHGARITIAQAGSPLPRSPAPSPACESSWWCSRSRRRCQSPARASLPPLPLRPGTKSRRSGGPRQPRPRGPSNREAMTRTRRRRRPWPYAPHSSPKAPRIGFLAPSCAGTAAVGATPEPAIAHICATANCAGATEMQNRKDAKD